MNWREAHNPPNTYLNTPFCGLIRKATSDKVSEFYSEFRLKANNKLIEWHMETLPRYRKDLADFFGCKSNELIFIPNFSDGLNAVLPSIKNRKRVLLYRNDFPALTQPFLTNDFEVTWYNSEDDFDLNEDKIKEEIINNEIEIFAISHIQYLNGYQANIKSIGDFCKKQNILFIVDGTQTLAGVEFDFSALNVDLFIASQYKWLNAGYGGGVMMIKEAFLEQYPSVIGGRSHKLVNGELTYEPTYLSYEPGHYRIGPIEMLYEATMYKKQSGFSSIVKHNQFLMNECISALKSINAPILDNGKIENRGPILCFKGDSKLKASLEESNISVMERQNIIRIGLHFYNDMSDINHLVSALDNFND